MGFIQKIKSLFINELNEISEITHYSNVDEQQNYYLVAIKDNVWLKVRNEGILTFTKNVQEAEIFKDETRAVDMANHIDGKAIRVVVVHYYDEI